MSDLGHVVLENSPDSSCTADVVFLGESIDTSSQGAVDEDLQLGVGFALNSEGVGHGLVRESGDESFLASTQIAVYDWVLGLSLLRVIPDR